MKFKRRLKDRIKTLEWRSRKLVQKLTTKIKRSKDEINNYPKSRDQRRESPSEIWKSSHPLIAWHLALTRSTRILSWKVSHPLLKSLGCGGPLDLECANLIGDWDYIKFSTLFKSDKLQQQASLFLKDCHITFARHFHLKLQIVPDSILHSRRRNYHTC